jgi:hypothetical protein
MSRICILLAVFLVPGAIVSGAAKAETGFDMPAEYRFHVNWLDDFPVDDTGRDLDRNYWHESRLRITPELMIGDNLAFHGQVDLFDGLVYGDEADLLYDWADYPWDGEDDYEDFALRQLWAEWTTPVGLIRVGQMSSQWGLGLVSNAGEDELTEFGESYGGDIYWRTLFATRPMAIFSDSDMAQRFVVGVGYDVVWHDDNADYEDGDEGSEWILSSFYDDPENLFTGVYIAWRDQEDDDGDELTATLYDFYIKLKHRMNDSGPVASVAFEGVYITGVTDRVIIETSPKELDVEGVGGVLRTGLLYPDSGFRLGLEMGYASGDANSYDDTNYALKFDPNFKAGIILFQEVMASLSAVAPEALADPNRVNQPQKGIDQLPTDGAVTNVFYQNLIIAKEPPEGENKGWTVKGGVLHAAAVEDFMDPYQTYKAGGVPTNFHGVECVSKELGWEFDGELSYKYTIGDRVYLDAGAQYGYFLPGNAFEDRRGHNGDPIQKLQTRVSVGW